MDEWGEDTSDEETTKPKDRTDEQRWMAQRFGEGYEATLTSVLRELDGWAVPGLLTVLDGLPALERRAFDRGEAAIVPEVVLELGAGTKMRCTGYDTRHLVEIGGAPAVVILERAPCFGGPAFWLEVRAQDRDEASALADALLEEAVGKASPFRGRGLRLSPSTDFDVELLPMADLDLSDPTLDAAVAAELRTNLVVPLTERERLGGLVPSRGVLLWGPPGTGKSTAMRAVRGSLEARGITVLVALPGALVDRESIDRLVEVVRDMTPCLVIIEELDLVAGGWQRMSDGGRLGDLLNLLDGLGGDGIFLLATTNRPEDLDEALTGRPGRIDRRIHVGAATAGARRSLLAQVAVRLDVSVAGPVMDELVRRTDGWTAAEVAEAGRLAAIGSVERGEPADLVAAVGLVQRAEGRRPIGFSSGRVDGAAA